MSVSVIIPAYNAQATIRRAVGTVLDQTRPPAEVIIVDDASTDETRAVVRQMAQADARVKLIESVANRGPAAARNIGFRAAQGEWVAIQDADDAWCDNRLELMLAAAERYAVDFVGDNMLLHDIGTDMITRTGFSVKHGVRQISPIDLFEQDVQLGAEFGYGLLQPLIRKSFLTRHEISYMENMRYGEDMIFLSELIFSGAKGIIIPDPLYIYTTRVGEHSGHSSPHSKSTPRFDLLADAIVGLKLKYPQAITPAIDSAMTRLARRYRSVHGANMAKQRRLQKGLLAYAMYLCGRPSVTLQVLRQRARAWRAKRPPHKLLAPAK